MHTLRINQIICVRTIVKYNTNDINRIYFISCKTIERTQAQIPHKPGGLPYSRVGEVAEGEVVYKFSIILDKESPYSFFFEEG